MPVLLIICTVHMLTRSVYFQFKMYSIKQVSPSKQVSAENVHLQVSVTKYQKSFLTTGISFLHWCVWQKVRPKNWQRKKNKPHHQTTSSADIVFHREKLSSALLLSYCLGGTTLPDRQEKSVFKNVLQKPARKSLMLKENKFGSLNPRALPLPSVG